MTTTPDLSLKRGGAFMVILSIREESGVMQRSPFQGKDTGGVIVFLRHPEPVEGGQDHRIPKFSIVVLGTLRASLGLG